MLFPPFSDKNLYSRVILTDASLLSPWSLVHHSLELSRHLSSSLNCSFPNDNNNNNADGNNKQNKNKNIENNNNNSKGNNQNNKIEKIKNIKNNNNANDLLDKVTLSKKVRDTNNKQEVKNVLVNNVQYKSNKKLQNEIQNKNKKFDIQNNDLNVNIENESIKSNNKSTIMMPTNLSGIQRNHNKTKDGVLQRSIINETKSKKKRNSIERKHLIQCLKGKTVEELMSVEIRPVWFGVRFGAVVDGRVVSKETVDALEKINLSGLEDNGVEHWIEDWMKGEEKEMGEEDIKNMIKDGFENGEDDWNGDNNGDQRNRYDSINGISGNRSRINKHEWKIVDLMDGKEKDEWQRADGSEGQGSTRQKYHMSAQQKLKLHNQQQQLKKQQHQNQKKRNEELQQQKQHLEKIFDDVPILAKLPSYNFCSYRSINFFNSLLKATNINNFNNNIDSNNNFNHPINNNQLNTPNSDVKIGRNKKANSSNIDKPTNYRKPYSNADRLTRTFVVNTFKSRRQCIYNAIQYYYYLQQTLQLSQQQLFPKQLQQQKQQQHRLRNKSFRPQNKQQKSMTNSFLQHTNNKSASNNINNILHNKNMNNNNIHNKKMNNNNNINGNNNNRKQNGDSSINSNIKNNNNTENNNVNNNNINDKNKYNNNQNKTIRNNNLNNIHNNIKAMLTDSLLSSPLIKLLQVRSGLRATSNTWLYFVEEIEEEWRKNKIKLSKKNSGDKWVKDEMGNWVKDVGDDEDSYGGKEYIDGFGDYNYDSEGQDFMQGQYNCSGSHCSKVKLPYTTDPTNKYTTHNPQNVPFDCSHGLFNNIDAIIKENYENVKSKSKNRINSLYKNLQKPLSEFSEYQNSFKNKMTNKYTNDNGIINNAEHLNSEFISSLTALRSSFSFDLDPDDVTPRDHPASRLLVLTAWINFIHNGY